MIQVIGVVWFALMFLACSAGVLYFILMDDWVGAVFGAMLSMCAACGFWVCAFN